MLRIVAIALGLITCSGVANAGWLTVKNETKRTIVIEEVTEGLLLKRGKTVRLLPGEVYREFRATPVEKTVQIFDPTLGVKPVYTGTFTWKQLDVTLRVEAKATEKATEWTLSVPPAKAETLAKRP